MSKLKALLAKVTEALVPDKALLARSQRRYKSFRKRAYQNHNRGVKAQGKADKLRGQGKDATATDREAARCHARAYKSHVKAQFWLGRIKALTQRIAGLESKQAEYEAQLKKLNKVSIKGNEASGGNASERLKAVALKSAAECSAGRRSNFYSQVGAWDVEHCITGERYGERSDCSSWVTSVYKSCGLKDPNATDYTSGYTGTLVANGKEVGRSALRPGDLVIYGSGTGHHVEMFVGPGDRTVGHGSAPVDWGTINLFGDGDYRLFTY